MYYTNSIHTIDGLIKVKPMNIYTFKKNDLLYDRGHAKTVMPFTYISYSLKTSYLTLSYHADIEQPADQSWTILPLSSTTTATLQTLAEMHPM